MSGQDRHAVAVSPETIFVVQCGRVFSWFEEQRRENTQATLNPFRYPIYPPVQHGTDPRFGRFQFQTVRFQDRGEYKDLTNRMRLVGGILNTKISHDHAWCLISKTILQASISLVPFKEGRLTCFESRALEAVSVP